MSDHPDSLEPLDSDPLEARIVAWVLGEASAFEAAELERLCEERPELLVFRRRMRALHGLLTEAEAAQPDESWKLPPEKRQALDEIFGQEKPVRLVTKNEERIRRSGRRALWSVAACMLLTLIVSHLLRSIWIVQETPRLQEKIVDFMPASPGLGSEQVEPAGAEILQAKEGAPPILVGGQVRSPGAVSYKDGITLGEAIDSSGGATEFGSTRRVRHYRDGTLQNFDITKKEFRQIKLEPGDTIELPDKNILGDGSDSPIPSEGSASGYAEIAKSSANEHVGAESMKSKLADDQITPGMAGEEGALAKNESDTRARFSRPLAAPKPPTPGSPNANIAGMGSGGAALPVESERSIAGVSDPFMDSATGSVAYLQSQPGVETEAQDIATAREMFRVAEAGKQAGEAEPLAETNQDYYRSAEDHRRAEILAQVNKDWELSVPADSAPSAGGGAINRNNIDSVLSNPSPQTAAPASPAVAWTSQDEGARPPRPRIVPRLVEIPAKELAEPMDELTSSDSPYSTFSLNISDASFKLAKAALEKGQRPDPAEVKVEQFYNAVDYGDPAPGAGEPVAGVVEQAAHPVIPGRNLVRVALRTAAAGRGASQPLRLTLLVDQSGSMVRDDRRAAMDRAVKQLAGLLTKEDRVTVIGFSRLPHLLAENLSGNEAAKLPGLLNQTADEGGTNLEEAMKLSAQMAERQQLAGAQNRIVLFTDGAANLGDADPLLLAEQVKALRQKGIAFDIAGIGADGLNDRTLSELARHGNGRYHVVVDGDDFARQLAGAFRPAAENVKVQVRFNPERVGKYKLVGFEKDRLKTEDFRNDKVDAAELAAEEAGVALYQVEPLAEGSGEIGEVSVRFRDTATGTMVERTWTIPYDPATPVFDKASPSIQLAGLSMLAGEKLRGGPLADAIDFKQLAAPRAAVKQFYGNSRRVGEMLTVIGALE